MLNESFSFCPCVSLSVHTSAQKLEKNYRTEIDETCYKDVLLSALELFRFL